MRINEACYNLANGKVMQVDGKKIRLNAGFYQYYCKEVGKWLFLEQNGIFVYKDSEWGIDSGQ